MAASDVRVVSEEVLCRGRRFAFTSVIVEVDGRRFQRDLLKHPGAVVIVPVLGEPPRYRVVMLRQWRAGCRCWLEELPAGTLEEGESPEETARRELEEETGFRPGRLEYLGSFYPTPGTSTEVLHFYLATGLERGEQRPEEDEILEVRYEWLDEALRRALRGEYRDAKTTLGLILAAVRLGLLPLP